MSVACGEGRRIQRPVGWVVFVALACAGCGLDDYESKMLEQQQRLERLDKENQSLGEPLQMPALPEEAPPRRNLYLRPPKGVQAEPKQHLWSGLDYCYPASGGQFAFMYLGWAGEKQDLRKDFQQALSGGQASEWSRYTTAPARGQQPVVLDAIRIDDPDPKRAYTYFFYATTDGKAAILYAVERSRADSVKDTIALSLSTLALKK